MKNQVKIAKQVGITLLGWFVMVFVTARIASFINPSTENISTFESFICLVVVFFGWVPFLLYFRKKNRGGEKTVI